MKLQKLKIETIETIVSALSERIETLEEELREQIKVSDNFESRIGNIHLVFADFFKSRRGKEITNQEVKILELFSEALCGSSEESLSYLNNLMKEVWAK